MGLLIEGEWHDQWYDTKSSNGEFIRSDAQFRNFITADGSSTYPAEPNRYHLYVSYACPWAHRTLIFRKLKGLEDIISVSVVDHFMAEKGWTFSNKDGAIPDSLYHSQYVHELYTRAQTGYSGRVTVPILWDKKTHTIVNNESSEIIRMLNSEFNEYSSHPDIDGYPAFLREDIDAINKPIYENINNGVYRCGFATTQEAYNKAYHALFETLDMVEEKLSQQDFLCGNAVTEADWRLFTTLIRFDMVYYSHFKCNRQMIRDFPNLSDYTRTLYQVAGVAETCNFHHIKSHYYASHETINPTRIVPNGPILDFNAPTKRTIPTF